MSDQFDVSSQDAEYQIAHYPIQLNIPSADQSLLDSAAEAVRREYLDSTRWKRLRCRAVHRLSQATAGTLFELEVGSAIDFDWTWEGGIAFRPLAFQDQARPQDERFQDDRYQPDIDNSVLWTGEILEVDETKGKIFIAIANPEFPPTTGTFFVRPFEFLAFLDSIFHDSEYLSHRRFLPTRLLASEGNIHPNAENYKPVGVPELRDVWRKSWSILWGPPGTGKTYTTGKQISGALTDPSERILVISTTNKATDAVALAIGRDAIMHSPSDVARGRLLRIGKGASLQTFEVAALMGMLKGTETELLGEIEQLATTLSTTSDAASKAIIRNEMKTLRLKMRDAAKRNFFDKDVRVVVTTAFRATTFLKSDELKSLLQMAHSPFTTVVIDEAGLISRASVAALSLLASRRVLLVGDSKQLAPISRISRLLPSDQMTWLASSGLSHLNSLSTKADGVHVLKKQYRMHPSIGNLISQFQYDNCLETAEETKQRPFLSPDSMHGQPRAIWWVLDDSGEPMPTIRAERGRGNRSWIRPATPKVLELLFSDLTMRTVKGMFISPFKGQVQKMAGFFAKRRIHSWAAATVHSQQGSEADIVIFDTVNAGSYAWPYDEWRRLINVAISRARESVIVLASRAEMREPFLRPLLDHLAPKILVKTGKRVGWQSAPSENPVIFENLDAAAGPLFLRAAALTGQVQQTNTIGYQIASRKVLRPILSHEQQRLCGLELDGKPRLVRGVAGSGKTVVLANWMMQTVQHVGDLSDMRIWAVFANRSLQGLIGDSLQTVWDECNRGKPFPWESVSLHHVRELLAVLLREEGLSIDTYQYDYDAAAAAYLNHVPSEGVKVRCDAMFIDEAQDMGPTTLKLLSKLVKRTDEVDLNSRAVNIFYDNAQNVYARATPIWSDFGLDMRGRSTVMKESFRSTKPVSEFALNVLYALQPPLQNLDHRELVRRGLIEQSDCHGHDWWKVRFNQIEGPKPTFNQYPTLVRQIDAIGAEVRNLVENEQVQPNDICIVYMGRRVKQALEERLAPYLNQFGVELSIQTNVPFARHRGTLLASTPHSFKGYDAEVVIVPGAEHFVSASGEIQANSLYVAMTRARSLLKIYAGIDGSRQALKLIETLKNCIAAIYDTPVVDRGSNSREELLEILDIIGPVHREWLLSLWNEHVIHQEPIIDEAGTIIAEPLFWFKTAGKMFACFGHLPKSEKDRQLLATRQIQQLMPSQIPGE